MFIVLLFMVMSTTFSTLLIYRQFWMLFLLLITLHCFGQNFHSNWSTYSFKFLSAEEKKIHLGVKLPCNAILKHIVIEKVVRRKALFHVSSQNFLPIQRTNSILTTHMDACFLPHCVISLFMTFKMILVALQCVQI